MVVNDRSDGKNHIYHVCTDGLSREIMFRDDSDYISGMNDIPICSLVTAIEVYCFCLMSNHVHFILNGTEYECMEFIRKYKRLRSLRTRVRYGNKRVDDTPGISVKILDDAEYQMSAISYVIRNPLAAGLKMAPWHYPWSSSFLYFSQGYDLSGYRKVSELGCKEFRETLKTRLTVPDNYLEGHMSIIHLWRKFSALPVVSFIIFRKIRILRTRFLMVWLRDPDIPTQSLQRLSEQSAKQGFGMPIPRDSALRTDISLQGNSTADTVRQQNRLHVSSA